MRHRSGSSEYLDRGKPLPLARLSISLAGRFFGLCRSFAAPVRGDDMFEDRHLNQPVAQGRVPALIAAAAFDLRQLSIARWTAAMASGRPPLDLPGTGVALGGSKDQAHKPRVVV
jgi:hypothetical protein